MVVISLAGILEATRRRALCGLEPAGLSVPVIKHNNIVSLQMKRQANVMKCSRSTLASWV